MTAVAHSNPIYETMSALRRSSTLQWLRGHTWGLFDQVLISGTNFATMVLTARILHLGAFGDFTLVYSALLFANIFQSTLITQPHNVLGASLKRGAYRRYTTGAALGQIAMVLIEALVAGLVAAGAYAVGWHFAPLLLALPGAIVGWQCQEFVRRVLYTEGRLAAAFFNDILSYGGQALATVALWWTGTLTGPLALHVLAGTSALGALLGAWQLRHSLCRRPRLGRAARENWRFGKWLVGAELLGYCSSIQMYLYIAAVLLGSVATGELKAAQILFGPTRVVAFFLGTVLPIRFARAIAGGGRAALRRQLRGMCLLVAPAAGIYCLAMALAAGPLLHLVYGADYDGSPTVLVLYAGSAFISYLQMVLSAALTGSRNTRYIFAGSVCGAVIAVTLSWMFIKVLGVNGAMITMMLATAMVTLVYWFAYCREFRQVNVESGAQLAEVLP
jgi:O-antigen/teichoic acid export membrane protein